MQQAAAVNENTFTLCSTNSEFIRSLYKGAQKKSLNEFKCWVFEQLHQIVEFDSGLWKTQSNIVDHQSINHYEYVNSYNLQFTIEHGLVTFTINQDKSLIGHVLNFYRGDHHSDFNYGEIQLLKFMMPNIIGAFRINVLSSFTHLNAHESVLSAVVDQFGIIVEAEDDFTTAMLELKLLEDNKVKLILNHQTQLKTAQINGYTIKTVAFLDGLIGIDLVEESAISQLSKRKKEVCRYVIEGLTDKEIGRKLGISHYTVSNHLKVVYKLLKVTSRPEAIVCLSKPEF